MRRVFSEIIIYCKLFFQIDEFLARHMEEKTRKRQAELEEKRRV